MSISIPLKSIGVSGLDRTKARESMSQTDAWVMENTRVFQGKLESSPGQTSFNPNTLVGRVMLLHSWNTDAGITFVNVYTDKKIYSVNDSNDTVTDITRLVGGDYTGTPTDIIQHATGFNHILSVNVRDNPQKWDGVALNASDIGGSPGKASAICVAMTYLLLGAIAGDPRGVKWSDSGAFEVWVSGDAGSLTLFQGQGEILALRPLGEMLLAYRENSIHMLFFVGTPFIWGQRQIISDHGLIAPRAITSLVGRHIYWGTDNIYIFDGSSHLPVGDKVISEMARSYDPSFKKSILAFFEPDSHEVYFCYAALGDNGVNKRAWVFNSLTGAWRQECIEATGAGIARRKTGNSWADSIETWASVQGSWGSTIFSDRIPLSVVGTNTGRLNFIDVASVDNVGVARIRSMETGIFQPGATIFNDQNARVTLEWLDVEQEAKGAHNLEVWIGTQDTLTGEAGITWTVYTNKADGSQRRITIRQTARYFAVRFRTMGIKEPFRISGIIAYFNKRGDA